jgi:hypothetical protein
VPGAATIRASVRDLALWFKIGIVERPTADLAIRWLNELPTGVPLSPDDARRVRSLLARHAGRIWAECKHWLNLAREWVPIESLELSLTMQSLVEWNHLHEWVKQKTADMQRLSAEIIGVPPFSELPFLAGRIEDRFHRNLLLNAHPERKAWLNQFGIELCRIEIDGESDQMRIRQLATDLSETNWQSTPGLEIVPYIAGTPAGTPKRSDVVWLDKVLYVDHLPKAKLARVVPDKLGKVFGRPDISAALNYCFGRSPEEVSEYLEENFKLTTREVNAPPAAVAATPAVDPDTPNTGVAPQPAPGEMPDNEGDEHVDKDSEVAPPAKVDEPRFEPGGIDIIPPREPHRPKPVRPSIIERFALSQGFQKDGEDRYFHNDGSSIAKTNGDRFPWERHTAAGELIRRYWPRDHCLENAPLQLEADIWGLIEKFPDIYALVLLDFEDKPVEMSGGRLREMREEGELILYPATYRLVLNQERDSLVADGPS